MMDFARLCIIIILYLSFFTLLGSLFGITTFPPPAVTYNLFSLPLGLGELTITFSVFSLSFLTLILFTAFVSIAVGLVPFVDIDSRFAFSVAMGVLLVVALGITLDGAMITLPWVFRLFLVYIPIIALGISVYALMSGGSQG